MNYLLQIYLQLGFTWQDISKWFNPQTILEVGGVSLFLLVIYVETGLLVGFFLPGDSLQFTAGLMAGIGVLKIDLLPLILLAATAAVLGDNTGYWIGRRIGKALYNKKETWYYKRAYVILTRAYFRKYGGITLIIGRFLPIVRTFAPLLAGVAEFPYKKYIPYSVFGGILWTGSLISVGYFLGKQFPEIQHYLEYVILIIVIVTTGPIIFKIWQETRKRKSTES